MMLVKNTDFLGGAKDIEIKFQKKEVGKCLGKERIAPESSSEIPASAFPRSSFTVRYQQMR